jgi:hypothetical protein
MALTEDEYEHAAVKARLDGRIDGVSRRAVLALTPVFPLNQILLESGPLRSANRFAAVNSLSDVLASMPTPRFVVLYACRLQNGS